MPLGKRWSSPVATPGGLMQLPSDRLHVATPVAVVWCFTMWFSSKILLILLVVLTDFSYLRTTKYVQTYRRWAFHGSHFGSGVASLWTRATGRLARPGGAWLPWWAAPVVYFVVVSCLKSDFLIVDGPPTYQPFHCFTCAMGFAPIKGTCIVVHYFFFLRAFLLTGPFWPKGSRREKAKNKSAWIWTKNCSLIE